MGIGPGRRYANCPTSAYIYRSTTPCEPAPASAPDPENWLALRIQPMSGIAGTYTVMMLQYPDCTNFEGRKVLVYPGAAKLDAKVPRDPHFADDGSGPIARFPPDDEGWRNALMFAEMLANLGAP